MDNILKNANPGDIFITAGGFEVVFISSHKVRGFFDTKIPEGRVIEPIYGRSKYSTVYYVYVPWIILETDGCDMKASKTIYSEGHIQKYRGDGTFIWTCTDPTLNHLSQYWKGGSYMNILSKVDKKDPILEGQLFENAQMGDLYVTADNQTAIYLFSNTHRRKDKTTLKSHCLCIDKIGLMYYSDHGIKVIPGPRDCDIVKRLI